MNFPISLQDTRLYLHPLYTITVYIGASCFDLKELLIPNISIKPTTWLYSTCFDLKLLNTSLHYLHISMNEVI